MKKPPTMGGKGSPAKGPMGKKISGFGSRIAKGKMGKSGMEGPCK